MNRDRLEYANTRNILSEVVPLDTPYVLFWTPVELAILNANFVPVIIVIICHNNVMK